MSKDKIKQIMIYRKGIDTPISLYDNSSIDNETYKTLLTNIFASPKISVIETSGSTIIIKPSQIDAIEILNYSNNTSIKKLPENELSEKTKTKFVDITRDFSTDSTNLLYENEKSNIKIDDITIKKDIDETDNIDVSIDNMINDEKSDGDDE